MTPTYEKILVPLDGSDLSEKALAHAALMAAQFGSKLVLLRVVPEVRILFELTSSGVPEAHSSNSMQEALLDDASAYLDQHVADLQRQHIQAEALVDIGDPADQIIETAASQNADLVIINTHGRSGVARWTYGSVANKVLQGAPCPVMLVRDTV